MDYPIIIHSPYGFYWIMIIFPSYPLGFFGALFFVPLTAAKKIDLSGRSVR